MATFSAGLHQCISNFFRHICLHMSTPIVTIGLPPNHKEREVLAVPLDLFWSQVENT